MADQEYLRCLALPAAIEPGSLTNFRALPAEKTPMELLRTATKILASMR